MKLLYRISFLLLFLCFFERTYANLPGYLYYKTITIQSSKVAGSGSHTNFPVLISHTDSDLRSVSNGGNVKDINGFDIAFSDALGNVQLNHQLEGYNPVTGKVSFWVQVPNLSALVNTSIRIYYGNPSVTTDQSTTNTWDGNFKAVYHLNSNINDGTSSGVDFNNISTTSVTGMVENGRDFTANSYLESSANSAVQINGDLTLSAWVKINTLQTGSKENCLISCSSPGESPFTNTLYYFNVLNTGQLHVYWENNSGFDNDIVTTNTFTSIGQYSLLSVTRNSNTKELFFYQNGVLIEGPISYSNNPNFGSGSYLRLGQNQENSLDDLVGDLDEVRISNNIRSQDWIITSYNSINDPNSFYQIGSQVFICDPPNITSCQTDVTVIADASCNYTLIDFTSSVLATDNCGGGLTYSQIPSAGTTLTAGVYPVKLYVADMNGQKDSCEFNLTIKASINPVVVSCGDVFTNVTTQGQGNNGDNYSCATSSTPGEDIFYQITVPSGNYQIRVKITNATDGNDSQINTYWLGSSCPSSGSCLQENLYDIGSGKFSVNNSNQLILYANGPGTYFFVVDSENDFIDNYDIEFNCLSSGIEFDESNCGFDTNNDGVYAEVNNSNVLIVEPCQSVTIAQTLYIKNVNNAEWLDSVKMNLGSCYTNIDNTTLTPNLPNLNTGFYNTNGEWSAVYDNATNSIGWSFTHSGSNSTWGDGTGSQYTCYTYTFSFDATISNTCSQDIDLDIQVNISDDGVATTGSSVPGFDYVNSSGFQINTPNVGWSLSNTAFCKNDPNPIPSIDIPGGVFSSGPGLVFVSAATGEIDLSASNPATYNVSYSNGLCPTDSTIQIVINEMDDANFNYSSSSYCQGESDPIANVTGLSGGIFSNTDGASLNSSNGQIDLSASSVGTHAIIYTTQGVCPNSDTSNVIINAEDDPSFNYLYSDYCQGDLDPSANITGGATGTFSNTTGLVFTDNTLGTIDVSASTNGTHTITFTTDGICPHTSTFNVTIHVEQDSSFTYPNNVYCNDVTNPLPTITGVSGGGFVGSIGLVFVDTTTGEIDLLNSTVGTHTVYYVTPGPFCQNTGEFNLTINQADDPSFGYLYNSYCQGDSDPLAFINGTTGGVFSSSTGIVFLNTSTGKIDLSASPSGPHQIIYSTPGTLCPRSSTFNLTIVPEEDPVFTYDSTFCQGDVDPLPTSINTPGGVFSNVTNAVTFSDVNTGLIDLSASATGTHVITYTTPGVNCQNQSTFTITIFPEDDPSFSYPSDTVCKGDAIFPIPDNVAQNGGVFSNSTGLYIDSLTGEVNLDSTSIGTYTITYNTLGVNCPNSSTFNLTILPEESPAFNYDDTLYCIGGNNAFASVTGTPNGTFTNSTGLSIDAVTGEIFIDNTTPLGIHIITYTTPGVYCPNSSTFNISIEPEQFATFTYPLTDYCQGESNPIPSVTGTSGGYFTNSTGVVFVDTLTGEINIDLSSIGIHTITYTTPGPNCVSTGTFNLTIYPEEDATFNYTTITFCKGDPNPTANILGTPNGTFSNLTGVDIDVSTGTINLQNSPAGQHTITYETPSQFCPKTFSFDITIYDEEVADFTYSDTAFCQRSSNPLPNLQGATMGGTFFNSDGLSIDPATGEVDLMNSAIGAHVVTYTTPGPNCINSSNYIIYVLQEDTASIDYGQLIYCSSSSNPIPNITGAQGGMFSNNSGVVINASTGEIDVASSPAGQHIVFYTTDDISCPFTTSDTITIQSLENPSFAYIDTAFCTIDDDPTPIIYGTQGGGFTNDSGIVLNPTTGEIDLSNSTTGYHLITYTTPDALCYDSLTLKLLILEPQVADAGEDQNLVFNFETDLEANQALNNSGIWNNIGNYNFDDVYGPLTHVGNLHLGDNILIWKIDDNVCPVSIDSVLINVKDLIVPQIITPNDDGDNDYLFIENIDLFENSVEIYNRWGQVVFKTDNYQNNWTGINQQGEPLINDTYFYIIRIEDNQPYKGFIVIKR